MRLSFVILLVASVNAFAQISYERGYFIDKNNKRTDCLIKNEDWLRNPTTLNYKLEPSRDPSKISIAELKEFAVSGNKYIQTVTQIDTSSQKSKTYTYSRVPLWHKKEVVLKVLVEGKANLYYYDDKNLVLFFFSVDNSPVEQLEYKTYFYENNRERYSLQFAKNLTYINQLKLRVSCGEEFSKVAQSKMSYTRDFLTNYFIRYNKCSGVEIVDHKTTERKTTLFHLKIAPGGDFSAAKVERAYAVEKPFPPREFNVRFGIEAEFLLPFNKNKWALFLEPTYQSYKNTALIKITYSSIEIPLGLRHYFYLKNNYKLFINAAVVFDFPLEYSAQVSNTVKAESNLFKINFAGGAGFAYKRFSIEGRYYSFRTGVDLSGSYHFDFTKASVILGYRVL